LRSFRTQLKADLHLSFESFIKEFISEPNDGIALLLDLLKVRDKR
jgi:hypothetical protein